MKPTEICIDAVLKSTKDNEIITRLAHCAFKACNHRQDVCVRPDGEQGTEVLIFNVISSPFTVSDT